MDNLDALLAGTLDDLADMPEFKNYPNGAHKVKMTWEQKKVNNKPSIEFKFSYIETLELADPTSVPPKVKDEAAVLCMAVNNDGSKNEFAEGTIKMMVAALKPKFGGASNGETLTAAQGAEMAIVTELQENKKNPGNFNMRLKMAAVA